MDNNNIKVPLSISISPKLLKEFDEKIGRVPRSVIIEELIINFLKGGRCKKSLRE